ncbi:stromal interaction molecule homolog isoform X2 [Pecten maximus]|uniref:stromal interaction molecule homolog isoform X2 n=1 Tax=Pecten maximus TaxID=6579 RepID=UPI001458B0F9|nr:stromal interaction molecule homolog isoform X2 [Pecten maximus]
MSMVTRTVLPLCVCVVTIAVLSPFYCHVVKTASPEQKPTDTCLPDDKQCHNTNSKDESLSDEFAAIQQIHHLIDDDQNGNVDPSESDEFMRDELQYTEGFERLSIFHGNDKLISTGDLWQAWKKSTVYNWTTEDVLQWLVKHVELPIYVETFRTKAVDGPILPRLAVTNKTYMVDVLGIKNGIHRQKISVKAMDLVLFGPPKDKHRFVRDLALILLLFIALGGVWFALNQHRLGKKNAIKFRKRLEALQKAELSLSELQEKLSAAEEQQRSGLSSYPSDNMDTISEDSDSVRRELTTDEKSRLIQAEEELSQVRAALIQAEERNKWTPPHELQIWLQLSYEMESAYFLLKKKDAYKRVQIVKEACDKMKKKRSAIFGSFRIATDHTMEESDHNIHEAKEALEDVNRIFKEKRHRWLRIEKLCDLSIINNPGKDALRRITQRNTGVVTSSNYRLPPLPPHIPAMDVGDLELDEDLPPGYPGPALFYRSSLANGLPRPSTYSGYPPVTLRQRPRDLGPGGVKPRPTTPVQAPITAHAKSPDRSVTSSERSTSVQESTSPEDDRPVFSLGENTPESPCSLPGSIGLPQQNGNSLVGQSTINPLHNSHSCFINGKKTTVHNNRDSMGNSSLPLMDEDDSQSIQVTRSHSEASLLKHKVNLISQDAQSITSTDSGSVFENGKVKSKKSKLFKSIFRGGKSKEKQKSS